LQDITIATRRYMGFCPFTSADYPCVDRMVRRGRRFILIMSPDRPGEPDIEQPYSLAAVFAWLREFPWQIERTVIQRG
jgi:hypothetical protein